MTFTLSLANTGAARHGIVYVAPRSGGEVTIDLPAGATRPVQVTVIASRRGRVPLGRITLSTDFPLGLWRGWAYVHFPLAGIAYPVPESPPPQLPLGLDGYDVRRSARAADAELAGLRDYHPGDALDRTITWTPSSAAAPAGTYNEFEGTGGGTLEFHWAELPLTFQGEARLARLSTWILRCPSAKRAPSRSSFRRRICRLVRAPVSAVRR